MLYRRQFALLGSGWRHSSGDTIMKHMFATVLALAVLAPGSGARVLAHEGHEHKVMGTVTMAAADHVMLKDKDGKDVRISRSVRESSSPPSKQKTRP